MGNLEKASKGMVACKLKEIGREDDSIKFNPLKHDIDYTKTHLNYSVLKGINGAEDMLARFNNRMSQVYCMNREDVKPLGLWVWTAPSDLPKNQIEPLFREITRFFIQKHGLENIAYAQVHLDEMKPHLHIGVIPVVKLDKPRKDGKTEKICAKEVFNKEYLNVMHDECQTFVRERLGCEVNLLNGGSMGVDGIVNYKKAKELAKQVSALELGVQKREKLIDSLDKEITTKQAHLKELNRTMASVESDLMVKSGELVQLRDQISEKKSVLEKMKEAITEISQFLKGSPNLLAQFYRWCSGWKESKEKALEVVDDYSIDMDVNLERINDLLVPDSAPKAPTKGLGYER